MNPVTIARIALAAVTLFCLGCSQNFYNVPRDTYEKQVRILGVAPIMTDADSDIRHPEKAVLVNMIKDYNRRNQQELVAQLRDTGTYYTVLPLDDDPDQLFNSLVFRRERREDAGIAYNKYFYKGPALKELFAKNRIDALLLVVVSGLSAKDTVRSCNLMEYLECDYNSLIMTGQVLDAEGNILWEYPNFKQRRISAPSFFALQYPDFDEARANVSDKVEVKFKTIPGIGRAFDKSEKSSVRDNVKVSELYNAAFDDMVSLQRPEFNWFGLKEKEKEKTAPTEETMEFKPVTATQPAPVATQPVAPVQPQAAPQSTIPDVTQEQPLNIAPPTQIKELPVN